MTPEQIVADWLEMPWLDVANDPNIKPLISTIRAYGATCAAAERERCARLLETKQAVSTPGLGWRVIDDDEPDRVRAAYAAAIRALD